MRTGEVVRGGRTKETAGGKLEITARSVTPF